MTNQPSVSEPDPRTIRSGQDWLADFLVVEADSARGPLLTGTAIGCVVGLVGAFNETDFVVLAIGILATFLSFFLIEAVLTAAARALHWVFSARVDLDPKVLIAAASDLSGGL